MKISERKDETTNFWISYADLMAGLLFVFVLLVGAIVAKYVLTQSDLQRLKQDLLSKSQKLSSMQTELEKKESALSEFIRKLGDAENKNIALGEINELFSQKLGELKTDLDGVNSALESLSAQNLDLSSDLSSKNEQIASLEETIAQKARDYDLLLIDLNKTKQSLENMSIVKIRAISNLQKKLGGFAKIDEKSGLVTLPTSVLFALNSFELKDEARFDLRRILSAYFDILLSDEIRPYLDKIAIEGHTDSNGAYLYNLELSQKRAYEVMRFIYSFYRDERLQKYLVASGRSFSDLVMKNGIEDAEASRRIEIKFSISDRTAMDELEKILERGK